MEFQPILMPFCQFPKFNTSVYSEKLILKVPTIRARKTKPRDIIIQGMSTIVNCIRPVNKKHVHKRETKN